MNIDVLVLENDSARLLSQFVEGMNLTALYNTYVSIKDNPVTSCQMLKLVLYAYLDGKYTSREMERVCKRDMKYMYLLEGRPAPEHAPLPDFLPA